MIDTNVANQINYQEGFNFMQGEYPSQLRTSPVVREMPVSGEATCFDWVGNVEARKIKGHVVKIGFDTIDLSKRWLFTDRYVITLPIDDKQKREMKKDPRSAFMKRCSEAFNRKMEKVIVDAATASVKVGKSGTSTVDFSADGGLTVTATGSTGFEYKKLVETKGKQSANGTGTDHREDAVIVVSDVEATTWLNQSELTSGDFDKLYTRDDKGRLTYALGMQVLQYPSAGNTDPILTVTGGERTCLGLVTNAITFGMEKAPVVELLDLKNSYYETEAVNVTGTFGAARNEGLRVVKIQTKAVMA